MVIDESAESSRLAQFVAFVAVAVGLFVMAGWALGLDQLTNIVPAWPRMVRLTALAFIVSGVALWLATIHARVPAIIAAALLAAIGVVILLRHAAGWDLYLDQLSFSPVPESIDGNTSPRMALATAIAFSLLGASLLFAQVPRGALIHQALAVAGMTTGWLGLTRYMFGGEALFAFADMAVHTAVLVLLLTGVTLTLRPDAGIARLLASGGVGGSMARRLLPAAIIVPLVAGSFALYFERHGVLRFETAVGLFALSSVVIFVAFVWINAARGELVAWLRERGSYQINADDVYGQVGRPQLRQLVGGHPDTHPLHLVDGPADPSAICDAIRQGRVTLHTAPAPLVEMLDVFARMTLRRPRRGRQAAGLAPLAFDGLGGSLLQKRKA